MDEDPAEREFSKSIVFDFFQQASETFEKMDKYLYVYPIWFNGHMRRSKWTFSTDSSSHSGEKDLDQLSALGHFLKGSSATLGLTKVKDSCEKIQHFGARKDETGTNDVDDDDLSLSRISDVLQQAKDDYYKAEHKLKIFYGDD